MTLSVDDVRNIKVGTSETFQFESMRECRNAQVQALRDARFMDYRVRTQMTPSKLQLTIFKLSNNGQ